MAANENSPCRYNLEEAERLSQYHNDCRAEIDNHLYDTQVKEMESRVLKDRSKEVKLELKAMLERASEGLNI